MKPQVGSQETKLNAGDWGRKPNVGFLRFFAETGQSAVGPAAAGLSVSLLADHGHWRPEMGYSQYDAAARGWAAQNAGKTEGTKRPLTQKHI